MPKVMPSKIGDFGLTQGGAPRFCKVKREYVFVVTRNLAQGLQHSRNKRYSTDVPVLGLTEDSPALLFVYVAPLKPVEFTLA